MKKWLSSTPPLSHPPVLSEGCHLARIVNVSLPKKRWGGRVQIRLLFEIESESSGRPVLVSKWLTLNYGHPASALRRVCALLVGSPRANFRALQGRECLVELQHRPGQKHDVLMLPVRVGKPDGSEWVSLRYGEAEQKAGRIVTVTPDKQQF